MSARFYVAGVNAHLYTPSESPSRDHRLVLPEMALVPPTASDGLPYKIDFGVHVRYFHGGPGMPQLAPFQIAPAPSLADTPLSFAAPLGPVGDSSVCVYVRNHSRQPHLLEARSTDFCLMAPGMEKAGLASVTLAHTAFDPVFFPVSW